LKLNLDIGIPVNEKRRVEAAGDEDVACSVAVLVLRFRTPAAVSNAFAAGPDMKSQGAVSIIKILALNYIA
jgi:hypothetical protein